MSTTNVTLTTGPQSCYDVVPSFRSLLLRYKDVYILLGRSLSLQSIRRTRTQWTYSYLSQTSHSKIATFRGLHHPRQLTRVRLYCNVVGEHLRFKVLPSFRLTHFRLTHKTDQTMYRVLFTSSPVGKIQYEF